MANYIDLPFADGDYRFALPIGQIDELQRKCDAGIGQIFSRVVRGAMQDGGDIVLSPGKAEFFALDVIETVRLGLIGGGRAIINGQEVKVTTADVRRLMENYVMNEPLVEAWQVAVAVLGAVIVGYEPPSGKDRPAGEETQDRTDETGEQAGST